MFFTLLLVTFALSALVSFGIATIFNKPVASIFSRIIQDAISEAWRKYITFAAYVTGISGGVRIYQLERYISAPSVPCKDTKILILSAERWALEVYRTIIGTLQSLAWMYLIVFMSALVAFMVVRVFEIKHSKSNTAIEK